MTRTKTRKGRAGLAASVALLASLAVASSADAFVYWANYGGAGTSGGTTIGRANNDGTGVDNDFIGGASYPCGVAVNDTHVFWANGEDDTGTTLGRAGIDGTGVNQSFITGASNPCFPTTDAGHVYWTNFDTATVGRANSDGSGVNQSFVTGAGSLTCGVAVNDSFVYVVDQDGNRIGRAPISGGAAQFPFIATGEAPCGIAVNSAHIYWTNREDNSIGRANLDGSGVDNTFITGASLPCGVAVSDTHIYWANLFNNTIGRANLDGTGVNQALISGVAAFPCGVAVDDNVRTVEAAVSCSPSGAAIAQPTTCTATLTDTNSGPVSSPTGSVGFASAAGGSGFPNGSSCTLTAGAAGQSSCSVTYLPGNGSNLVLGFYDGDANHGDAQDVGQVNVGSFALGALRFNRGQGTATLSANVPGPGTVSLDGQGVAPATAQASASGAVPMTVRAQGSTLRKLKRTGRAGVVVQVEYDPTGGGRSGADQLKFRLLKKVSAKKKKRKKRR